MTSSCIFSIQLFCTYTWVVIPKWGSRQQEKRSYGMVVDPDWVFESTCFYDFCVVGRLGEIKTSNR